MKLTIQPEKKIRIGRTDVPQKVLWRVVPLGERDPPASRQEQVLSCTKRVAIHI